MPLLPCLPQVCLVLEPQAQQSVPCGLPPSCHQIFSFLLCAFYCKWFISVIFFIFARAPKLLNSSFIAVVAFSMFWILCCNSSLSGSLSSSNHVFVALASNDSVSSMRHFICVEVILKDYALPSLYASGVPGARASSSTIYALWSSCILTIVSSRAFALSAILLTFYIRGKENSMLHWGNSNAMFCRTRLRSCSLSSYTLNSSAFV